MLSPLRLAVTSNLPLPLLRPVNDSAAVLHPANAQCRHVILRAAADARLPWQHSSLVRVPDEVPRTRGCHNGGMPHRQMSPSDSASGKAAGQPSLWQCFTTLPLTPVGSFCPQFPPWLVSFCRYPTVPRLTRYVVTAGGWGECSANS
jgi:hypothetical protein